jgi:opacity protein-like surface antigen
MKHQIKKSKLAVVAGCALWAACATTMQADVVPGFYMNADTGVNLMTGIRGQFEPGGGPGNNIKLDPGTRFGLEVGYGFKLADQLTLGVEAESGFIWNGGQSYSSDGFGTELGGNLYQVPILANVIGSYHFGKFTAYVGAGGGFDYISANVWSVANGPVVAAGQDFGPAVQGIAGLKYALSDKMELGLGYKYLTAFSEKLSGQLQDRLSEVNNHSISLTFTYHF